MLLIKKIEGIIEPNIESKVDIIKKISTEVGIEDFINISNFKIFTQNFKKTPITLIIDKPLTFGFKKPIGLKEINI